MDIKFEDELNWKNCSLFDFVYVYKFVPIAYKEFFNQSNVKETIRKISDYLQEETKKGAIIYPKLENVFKAFYYTPVPKVVILGMDPYATTTDSGSPTARGLSFSVTDRSLNPSLQNIQKEVVSCGFNVNRKTGDLSKWSKQGVLLLNTALTVQAGNSGSHLGIWSTFTNMVLTYLTNTFELVFFMWGRDSQAYEDDIKRKEKHKVLKSSHPVPYAANKPCGNNPPFNGCRHFKLCNEYLESIGVKTIDWSI